MKRQFLLNQTNYTLFSLLKRKVILYLVIWLSIVLNHSNVLSKTITSVQAQLVVENWLKIDANPLGIKLESHIIKDLLTFYNNSDEVLYYIVYLYPNGFVIVPGEDLVEPIICFSSEEGRYIPSSSNPLGALVLRDVVGRVTQAREMESNAIIMYGKFIPIDSFKESQDKWNWLLYDYQKNSKNGYASISDIRVAPLIQSKWNQGDVAGGNCYNYYTPNHYVCGCVATAMAQLMRYHSYPTVGVGTDSFTIEVDGFSQTRNLRGGNGSGGAYIWGSMPLSPSSSITTAQRQAIGALTYDAGISVNMSYKSGGSGAVTGKAATQFVNTFKYSNARNAYNANADLPVDNRNAMVNPNLDAGYPVLFGIYGTSAGGHAIVCDGYGYNTYTLYHHLNMGWSGQEDLWYNLPNVSGSYTFTSVTQCVYNVYKTGSGEIISGCITESNGTPINGATVTAIRSGGGTYSATSNEKGIYALAKIPSSSTYNLSVNKSGYAFTSKNVSTSSSQNDSINTGNKWGIDFTPSAVLGPTAITGSATSISFKTATLNGTVNPNGNSTTYYFQYGTTTNYGSTTTISNAGSGIGNISVSMDLTELTLNTTYHFRLVAENSEGISYGSNKIFTTSSALQPTVITQLATSVASTTATLNGTINPNGASTTYYFQYGTTTSYGSTTSNQSAGYGTSSITVTTNLIGLIPNTTYHFRLVAENSLGTTNGSDMSFKTSADIPIVLTGKAISITPTSATIQGSINPNGAVTTYYFQYGTTTNYGLITAIQSVEAGTSIVNVTANIIGLIPNITYNFRLVAQNEIGTTNGIDVTFTTPFVDLVVTSVLTPIIGKVGETISCVTATVKNQGTCSASQSRLNFYLSNDSIITLNDIDITWGCDVPQLSPGETYTVCNNINIPFTIVPETYYLGAFADSNGYGFEIM
ncbi:MAG: C10 family peptidase [Desulfobacterales bacterium]|nr:C10 family peptidase [Desulfobacterales bacterium]